MSFGLVPLIRKQGKTFLQALRFLCIGEVISFGVMEIAVNSADYYVGGMQAMSVVDPVFWLGRAAAIPANFLAAWPVNWWLIQRDSKRCHLISLSARSEGEINH